MNRDVLTEIFSHLPTQSLLRSRAVSKLWRDVVDSPPDAVYLQFRLPNDRNRKELLIELQHNGRSLMSYESDHLDSSALSYSHINDQVVLSGPVKGLICIYAGHPDAPIAICNPFLGQVKLLPSSSNSSRDVYWHEVSIGFNQDYKVVPMQWRWCSFVHAQLYCKKTNSWRELAGDSGFPDDLRWADPIKSLCKDGYTLHWWAGYVSKKKRRIILSLDMKNEVFRTISLPDSGEIQIGKRFLQKMTTRLSSLSYLIYLPVCQVIYQQRFMSQDVNGAN